MPSVVVGGVAVGAWGDPRLTRDVDLKVLLDRQEADRLLAALGSAYVSLFSNSPWTIRHWSQSTSG